MKILSALLFVFAFLHVSQAHAQLRTVPQVDVARYAGTWYQIARNPLIFEGNCICSRQVLSGREDGRVDVYNSCNEPATGELREIRGIATCNDPMSNSQFTVDFGLPHTGQYWIIALASDYSYAVVSDPSELSLYILSKTPTLSQELFDEAVAMAKHSNSNTIAPPSSILHEKVSQPFSRPTIPVFSIKTGNAWDVITSRSPTAH